MHPDWAREIRDHCLDGIVAGNSCDHCRLDRRSSLDEGHWAPCERPAFFFKQWGEYTPTNPLDWRNARRRQEQREQGAREVVPRTVDHGGREYDGSTESFLSTTFMYRVGKKKAGRELDGRTWDEFPARQAVVA